MYPLTQLIKGRDFERFQPGLRSRFEKWGFRYEVTYCKPSDNTAMYIDIERDRKLGRLTVWESGECDVVVANASDGSQIWKHYELHSQDEFHQMLANLFLHFRDEEPLP